jgi:hypothetical protein
MRDATQALTVLAEIAPGSRGLLEQRLAAIAADLDGNPVFRPRELPDTHFMRLVIIDDPRGEFPALLAWETNHDGRAADYLARVARSAPSIAGVFECCTGHPAGGTRDLAAWVGWMRAHAHPARAFYSGYRGVPRSEVINDRRVHDAIRDLLDRADRDSLDGVARVELPLRIRERIAARAPELDLAPTGDDELRWLAGKLAAIAAVLALAPVLLVLGPVWYLVLRYKESRDLASAYARPVACEAEVRGAEACEAEVRGGRAIQSPLTHVVDIKPGAFRLATLWLVLTAIDVVARVYSVRGDLGGITAIHFARWVIVRDRRTGAGAVRTRRHRLVFFSSYDGSWESYLGEFIDRASYGLTGVWSNTVGFPATRHLVLAGARDEEAFKQWTREHQIPTQVWWSGVPDATVQNVRDDIAIRRRLAHGMPDHELEAWLRML